MKKNLLIIVFSITSLVAFSQAKVQIGLKGGLNVANINRDDAAATYESTTGYHVGVYGLIKVLNIGIQPEILYSLRGTQGEIDFNGAKEDFSQDFVYLDIPIMLKVYLPLGLNLQAGPQFGMLLSAEGETPDSNGGTTPVDADNFKNADLSAAFGLGWDMPFGLNVTARYVLGLNDINDISGATEAKNRMFQLSLGYKLFGVGR